MEKERTFVDWFFEIALPEHKNRIYIEGDGGFGKTISLKYLCKVLVNNYDEYRIIPMYLDAKLLTARTIPQYIIRNYCGDCIETDITKEDILIQQLCNYDYKYLLIIDGLNEIDSSIVYKKIIDFIYDEVFTNENIYIVLSSRTPLSEYKLLDKLREFISIKLEELNKEKVRNIIQKKINNPSDLMVSVFTNPMMLSIYVNTHSKEKYKDIVNQSQVLDIYFEEQWLISNNWRKDNVYEKNYDKFIKFIILEYLPNLCRFGEILFQIEDIEYNLTKTDYKNSAFGYVFKQNRFDEIKNLEEKYIEIKEYLRDDLRIINDSIDTFTIHEKYSSYFQAKYFDLTLDAWLKDTSKTPEFLLVKVYDFMSEYNDYSKCFIGNHFQYFSNAMRCLENIRSSISIENFKTVISSYFMLFSMLFYFSINESNDKTSNNINRFKKDFSFYIEMSNKADKIQYQNYINIIKKYFDIKFNFSKYLDYVSKEYIFELTEEKSEQAKNELAYVKLLKDVKKLYYDKSILNSYRWLCVNGGGLALRFNPIFPDCYQFINFFLNDESKEFIYQISNDKISKIISYLYVKNSKPRIPTTKEFNLITEKLSDAAPKNYFDCINSIDNEFEIYYSVYIDLIKDIVLHNRGNLGGLDFSNLDLSSINLSGIDFYDFKSNQSIDLRNTIINKQDLLNFGYYAVPCVHSDEIKLLWYTESLFAVSYPYRKEVIFIFDGISSILSNITSNYRFVLETNRSSYCNYNFLYIPKGTKDLCSYNFILKSGTKLFSLNDIKLNDIKMITWMNCCNHIMIVYRDEKIFFDINGNLLERRPYVNEQLNSDAKNNNLCKLFLGDENTYLVKENLDDGYALKICKHYNDNPENQLEDKEFIIGKIGDSKYKVNQYQFNDETNKVMAGCQYGKTVQLKEWTRGGQYIGDINFVGTIVDKCFITIVNDKNYLSFYGFDLNYYYQDINGNRFKIKLLDLPFLGVTFDGHHFIYKLNNGLKFYNLVEGELKEYCTLRFDDILSNCNLNINCVFASAFVVGNSVILSFEEFFDDYKYYTIYFVKISVSDMNISIFNKRDININQKKKVIIDSYNNNLNLINKEFFNILSKKFSEYDNFDFFDLNNYNFFVIEKNLIISSSSIEKTIIFDMDSVIIKEVLNNTIIYTVSDKVLYVNSGIDNLNELRLKEFFIDSVIYKVNSSINFRNFKNACFSKNQFTNAEIEFLKKNGAIVE